jgi:hypothetical protein
VWTRGHGDALPVCGARELGRAGRGGARGVLTRAQAAAERRHVEAKIGGGLSSARG